MSWDSVFGQDTVVRLLRAHLASGRTATGYLLAGPEGIGKRRIALEFAKALNCKTGRGAACEACATCGQIARQAHPDVHWLVPSGASDQIKIEDIRQLLGRVSLRPYNAAYQVAIIDGAERLTEEAANSLLKSLEEPSARTRYVLTTAQLPRCLATVVSRCQLLRCQPLAPGLVERWLVASQACDPSMAREVAARSQGSLSRAQRLIEHWQEQQGVLGRLADSSARQWTGPGMPESRQEVGALLEIMVAWVRDLASCAAVGALETEGARRVGLRHADRLDALSRQAARLDPDQCLDAAFELLRLRDSLEQFVSPRLIASLAREQWLTLTEGRTV